MVTGDRAGGRIWCLQRVGMNAERLLLKDGKEVSGRSALEEAEAEAPGPGGSQGGRAEGINGSEEVGAGKRREM